MKYLYLFIALVFLSACASSQTINKEMSLSFDKVKNIVSDSLSQKEILEKLGQPTMRTNEGNKERWLYTDAATISHRVTVVFSESKKVEQLSWMPLPDRKETQIETILAQYPKGHFKPSGVRALSSDNLDTETTFSNNSSMAILHNDARKEVEAVVWYIPKHGESDSANPMSSR